MFVDTAKPRVPASFSLFVHNFRVRPLARDRPITYRTTVPRNISTA
jgi:hypothetical protein